jgi:hypothetical protein
MIMKCNKMIIRIYLLLFWQIFPLEGCSIRRYDVGSLLNYSMPSSLTGCLSDIQHCHSNSQELNNTDNQELPSDGQELLSNSQELPSSEAVAMLTWSVPTELQVLVSHYNVYLQDRGSLDRQENTLLTSVPCPGKSTGVGEVACHRDSDVGTASEGWCCVGHTPVNFFCLTGSRHILTASVSGAGCFKVQPVLFTGLTLPPVLVTVAPDNEQVTQ